MARPRLVLILVALAGFLFLLGSGCDELVTETIEVTIAGHPTAEFSYKPDSGCIPLTVTFKDASSGPVNQWIWNFGDSAMDTLYADSGAIGDISHTYSEIGSFTVSLTVFGPIEGSAEGGTDVEVKKRAVIAGHNVDSFGLSENVVCPGDSIVATVYGPVGIENWRWEYGDGRIRTFDSLVHTFTYSSPGEYEVMLRVTGQCGSTEMYDTVLVLQCAEPLFYAEPKIGCLDVSGLVVKFLDTTVTPLIDADSNEVGTVVQWDWDFGNGETQSYTGSQDTIPITYTTAGTFLVTLTVTTNTGGVTSFTDTIVTFANDAGFSAAPKAGCYVTDRQMVVAFTRQSTGDTLWIWDFGDGGTSELQNPYHAYTAPGVYTVQLYAENVCGGGNSVVDSVDLIEYADPLDSLVDFTSVFDSLATELTGEIDTVVVGEDTSYVDVLDSTFWYTFTDISPAAVVVRYDWDFGDETPHSAAGPSAVHGYDTDGSYDVALTRSNTCGSVTDTSLLIIVK
jgi:PKD repeat protein